VNFDVKNGPLYQNLKDSILETEIDFKSSSDCLKYLDQDIIGCSTPQFYLKVSGVYTGAHQ